jgi:hypothetical protein
MPWLIYAFSGPVLWALSTHIDKYLVERYFKQGSVAVLMVFTAIIGVWHFLLFGFSSRAWFRWTHNQ